MPVGLGRGDLARARPARFFRHDVKLQLIATDVVFAHRPFFEVHGRSRTEELFFDTRDGALLRKNDRTGLALETLVRRPTQIDYQVLSYPADHEGSQPSERFPDDGELALLREVGDAGLRARLREIALPIVENIPAEDIEGRARAIEAYLTDPDRFTYSLRLERIDRTIDPVLDFLINRRQGHCEYFASAAVLLCRSIGIPARLINGFKGGDWNTLSQALNVRQKHAHSWAEILTNAPAVGVRLREGTRRAPLWLEVDPTPSAPRAEMVAHVGGGNPEFRSIYDFVRYVWLFYVVGFDRDRQQRAIYEPVLGLWARCREGVVRIGEVLWRGLRWLLDFRDINEIFSFRGFLAVFFTLLVASLVGLLGLRVARRIRVSLSRAAERRATREIGGVYLKRLAAILGRIGLTRSDAETPREFAERAAGVLSLRADPGLEPLERIPTRVVEGYYEVRFGHRASVVELHTSLKAELDRLDVLVRSKGR
jgi:transglutaminase-like putative cysteine protease